MYSDAYGELPVQIPVRANYKSINCVEKNTNMYGVNGYGGGKNRSVKQSGSAFFMSRSLLQNKSKIETSLQSRTVSGSLRHVFKIGL